MKTLAKPIVKAISIAEFNSMDIAQLNFHIQNNGAFKIKIYRRVIDLLHMDGCYLVSVTQTYSIHEIIALLAARTGKVQSVKYY